MHLKTLRYIIIVLCLMLISGYIGYWQATHKLKIESGKLTTAELSPPKITVSNTSVPEDKNIDFTLFWEVWEKLGEKYFEKDKVVTEKMFYGAIQGMTAALGDPYTVFLPPTDNQQAKEDLNGAFEGVGMQLGYKDENRLAVIAPLKGSPAEAAGVKAGDYILHLKDTTKGIDEDTAGITLPAAVEKIRGPKGTIITISFLSATENKQYSVDLKRDTIVIPSVEVSFLENDKIAHLKLSRFGDLTAQQWDNSIEQIIDNKQVRGVILDLRGNPGGYLKGSINLASEFLSEGVIVKQENYKGEVETYSVNRRGRLLDIPLVVLVDKGSASASEILAGALRDHNRAKLVGQSTFGKGTIQETEELPEGAGLHITTAKWLTPNDTWVNKTGLKPDYELENDLQKPEEDKQLDKAIEILNL